MNEAQDTTTKAIIVNEQVLEILEWDGKRVVTFEQIALVHGITRKNVEKSYRVHANRFQEGYDTYLLDFAQSAQLLLRVGVKPSPNGMRVFTERGYLKLVKPMRDETSWQVQDRLVETYFRYQQILEHHVAPPSEQEQLTLQNARYKLLTTHYEFLAMIGMLDDRDKLMIADFARQNLFGTIQPSLRTSAAIEESSAPLVTIPPFFVADRVRTLGYRLSRKQEASVMPTLGTKVAQEYRRRYKREPEGAQRFVDGALRPVRYYVPEDAAWIDVIIQTYLTSRGIARAATSEQS